VDNIIKSYRVLANVFEERLPQSRDDTEETFSYSIKFINNMLPNINCRSNLLKYRMMIRVSKFYGSKNKELVKELAKYFSSFD